MCCHLLGLRCITVYKFQRFVSAMDTKQFLSCKACVMKHLFCHLVECNYLSVFKIEGSNIC